MRTVTSKVNQLSLARLGGQRPPSLIFAQHRSHNSPCQLVPRPSLSRLSAKKRLVAARPASRYPERQAIFYAPVKQAAKWNAVCEAWSEHMQAVALQGLDVMVTPLYLTCSWGFAFAASMTEAPVGDWKSPISSELIVSQSIRLGSPIVAQDGSLVWSEGRPTEGGRQVLVRR